jgi:hypothetical protein
LKRTARRSTLLVAALLLTPAAVAEEKRLAPCPAVETDQPEWLDRFHLSFERSVCLSAWRFDSLFGEHSEEELAQASSTFGRVRLGVEWDEQDGFGEELRLRATIPLPVTERRLKAVIGRETDEEFIEDAPRAFDGGGLLDDEEDPSWLVGLGYEPIRGRRTRLSIGAGVHLQLPLDPYVKARYRFHAPLTEDVLVRAQQTVFWENEDGPGTTTRTDLDWLVNVGRMLRWSNDLKLTEETNGVAWSSSLTLYQRLAATRAVALRGAVRGETDGAVSPEEYEVLAIYRQRFLRDWLFLEVRGGGGWLREERAEARDFVPQVGLLLEMVFGRDPGLAGGAAEAP